MIVLVNAKRVLRSQYSFFERVKFYPAKMIDKEFDNSKNQMKWLSLKCEPRLPKNVFPYYYSRNNTLLHSTCFSSISDIPRCVLSP